MSNQPERIEKFQFIHYGVLSRLKRWGIKWSLWPVHLVTACCGVELAHAYACGYDAERLGSLYFGMCRQANVIVIEGTVTRKMAKILKMTYEQMPEPKFVIAMGSCAIKGGVFWNSYHIVRPWEIVPVDVFISGCPPTPEALLRAIRTVQEMVFNKKMESPIKKKVIELEKVVEKPAEVKLQKPPAPPVRISPKPKIVLCQEKKVNWPFGQELVNKLKELLSGLVARIVICDVNRLCLETSSDKIIEVAKKLREFGFDHVKSVNVIDLIHEKKFIVEYVVSSFSVSELMPVLLHIHISIPRDNPRIPSLIEIWPSADYMEREMHEFFGIWFEGNPWMGRNFLIDPDTPIKYPLRKDVKVETPIYTIEVKVK